MELQTTHTLEITNNLYIFIPVLEGETIQELQNLLNDIRNVRVL
jgi:hypothetical protein